MARCPYCQEEVWSVALHSAVCSAIGEATEGEKNAVANLEAGLKRYVDATHERESHRERRKPRVPKPKR
jgi:hypothetical protein